jgi:hypothetical protein
MKISWKRRRMMKKKKKKKKKKRKGGKERSFDHLWQQKFRL